jgi:hypothetical protein
MFYNNMPKVGRAAYSDPVSPAPLAGGLTLCLPEDSFRESKHTALID